VGIAAPLTCGNGDTGNDGKTTVTMQLQELPEDLSAEIRRWATTLRELADATGEPTATALAAKLNCSPPTLSRYLQGQRPQSAFDLVVPQMVTLAAKRGKQTWSIDGLRTLANQAAGTLTSDTVDALAPGPGVNLTSSLPASQRETPSRGLRDSLATRPTSPERSQQQELVEVLRQEADLPPEPTRINRPTRQRFTFRLALVATGIAILCAGAYGMWSSSNAPQESVRSAKVYDPASPSASSTISASAAGSTVDNQVPERHCALVVATTSPVWVNVDDGKPLKWKAKNDRVRLIDIPVVSTPDGAYQAVLVPKDSPTGQGWMPVADIAPTSCVGLP
jgi:hypothetical protein